MPSNRRFTGDIAQINDKLGKTYPNEFFTYTQCTHLLKEN